MVSVTVLAIKPTRDTKTGIGLTTFTDGTVRITSIPENSMFASTDLKCGMTVETINGVNIATSKEAVTLMKEAEDQVVIVASFAPQAPSQKRASVAPTNTVPNDIESQSQKSRAATSNPARTSGKAIASMVCGIISIFFIGFILGPVAICLGASAKNDIKEDPDHLIGMGQANAGIACGCAGLTIWVIAIIIAAVA